MVVLYVVSVCLWLEMNVFSYEFCMLQKRMFKNDFSRIGDEVLDAKLDWKMEEK